jgi:two-component system, OmpR family, KDP operon response regulator KdpE
MNAREILIIEDDERIRRILQTILTAEGYRVGEASTLAGGALLAIQRFFDLIILDLELPDGNGIDIIRKTRQSKRAVPIIVLSACSNESDKIAALDAGADDFIIKPIAMGELLARVRSALRRSAENGGRTSLSIYRTGEIEVDLNKQSVHIAGNEVRLTRIEFKLLEILIGNADSIVTYRRLLSEVWGPNHKEEIHYLRTYMLQLRRKLEADPCRPRYLLTQTGVGYRLATQHYPQSWKKTLEASVRAN